ncbi:MAG: hypothetical protein AAFX53_13270 [Bacteroidota bacterium]
MRHAELNPEGDFTNWDEDLLNELRQTELPLKLGNRLLFENDRVRLWEIRLAPQDKLPFRAFKNDYSWSCPTGGMVVERNGNGSIWFSQFEKEDKGFVDLKESTQIKDIQNIGFENLRMHILEYL